ncbi:MAG: ankyrin repeat domain-containing protein [Legionellaceae bacterium]|nr:ankyrin repeat domain-containing protein [Legionellaceae bacterium]
MNITGLVSDFIVYLQSNYEKLGSSRYQLSWIEQQATDFRHAMLYAEQSALTLFDPSMNGDVLADFIKNIHRRCAQETYRIAANAVHGETVQSERVGLFRTSESFSMKNVPILNIENANDTAFLRTGKMPRLLDGRLQLMGLNPKTMSQRDKERAMHGQLAWLDANNVVQIAAYVYSHISPISSYYFLCGYYRDNFMKTARSLTEKDKMFAQFLETEINNLGKSLELCFNKASNELSPEEQSANELVYITYLSPDKIPLQFSEYTHDLVQKIHGLDRHDANRMADFCLQTFQRYIRIHPFLDANYRTFGIFMNMILSHAGYEYLNFHDSEIKRALNTPFGKTGPEHDAVIHILSTKLTKKHVFSLLDESSPLPTRSGLWSCEEPGKAIRSVTANGKNDELLILLKNHPDMINAIDQNPSKGWTALHWAVHKNQLHCMSTLLSFGVQYNITDKTSQQLTAIDLCLLTSNHEIHQLFVEHIQQKYMKSELLNVDKLLRTVSNFGDLDAVKMLIAAGANINSFGPETGQTALHRATQQKHVLIVATLIEHGADLAILDRKGKRAIDYAENDEHLLRFFDDKTQLSLNGIH